MSRFNNKIVMITGAGRGLGAEIARALAAEGAHVLAIARTTADLEALDDLIQADHQANQTGGSATLIPFDLTQHDMIDQIATNIAERFGRLDGLIANADILLGLQPLTSITNKVWDQALDTGVNAHFRLLRVCDPLLQQSEAGRVLVMSAESAHNPRPFWGSVAINKAAMEAMCRTYAAENDNSRVCANILDPGRMPTAWLRTAFPGQNIPEDAEIPEHITQVALQLVSHHEVRNGQRITP